VLRFAVEWSFAVAALLVLGAMGAWVISPLRRGTALPVLAAPLAGLLLAAVMIPALYSVAGLPFRQAALLALSGNLAIRLAVGLVERPRPARSGLLAQLALLAAVAGVVTILGAPTTLRTGEPSLLDYQGTDQLGYAQPADWVLSRKASELPLRSWLLVTPDGPSLAPYESWVQFMYSLDPRAGSYSLLAVTAWARGLSGMFAYESLTVVALTAGVCAVVGTFARSRTAIALLVVGLLTSLWAIYPHQGFLGRVLAYPGTIVLTGLLIQASTPLSTSSFAALIALAAGVASVHGGVATAALVTLFGGVSLLTTLLASVASRGQVCWVGLRERAILLACVAGAAVAISGVITRPLGIEIRDFPLDWLQIGGVVAEIYEPPLPPTPVSREMLSVQLAGIGVMWLAVASIAVARGHQAAWVFLGTPTVLILALATVNSATTRWAAYNLAGVVYPSILVGSTMLLDSLSRQHAHRVRVTQALRIATVAAILVVTAVHLPRFAAAVAEYGIPSSHPLYEITWSEMDQLVREIGAEPVEVDIENRQLALVCLVELGRRGIDVQWTPRSWKAILAYRPWSPPTYGQRARLQLRTLDDGSQPADGATVFQSRQFVLISRS